MPSIELTILLPFSGLGIPVDTPADQVEHVINNTPGFASILEVMRGLGGAVTIGVKEE